MSKEQNKTKILQNQYDTERFRKLVEEIPSRIKTLKVDIRVWDSLKQLKKENETFNDVIKEFLNKRTKSIGDDNVKAIKYSRKTAFFNTEYGGPSLSFKRHSIGVEFEYNDAKNQKSDFILDVKIKKVFHGKRVFNPSDFFGVDGTHKHYNKVFLILYLKAVGLALEKEFKVHLRMHEDDDYQDIVKWRKIYYDYNLSEESFKQDIEDLLRLSEEEKPTDEWIKKLLESVSGKKNMI
jgi:predicted CopG family antitoxin